MFLASDYKLDIHPITPSEAGRTTLPDPWPALEQGGIDADLLIRACGFRAMMARMGKETEADVALTHVGDGFARTFDRSQFEPAPDDPHAGVKRGMLAALDQLSREFAGRVSAVVWDALAFMGTRDNPLEEASILSQAERLPAPYYVVDSAVHALGKVYRLKHHVDSAVFAHTGLILDHNCDCKHSLYQPDGDGVIRARLPNERHVMATAALMSHLLSEMALMMVLKLPFEIGVSPEAPEVMAFERTA